MIDGASTMLTDQNAQLTAQEFRSLVQLSREADPNAIPREHRQTLARLGFIRRVGVDLLITSYGRLRLMRGS
jgi:hypothetical protein